MIILLSPTKTFTNTNIYSDITPFFTELTNNLLTNFKKLSENDFKTKFKISDSLANKTYSYYQNFKNQYRAINTYGGTAFKHLDAITIPQEKTKDLYILSALYGILHADDAISKYRFEMQSTIFGSMYDYWSDKINDFLIKKYGNDVIINLASKEYDRVLNFDKLNIVTINFANIIDNKLKSPSMMVKRQRGLMARAIMINNCNSLDNIKSLVVDGYNYNKKYSSKQLFMFTKGEF